MGSDVKFEDSAGTPNSVTLNVQRVDQRIARKIEEIERPSNPTDGELNTLLMDYFKTARIFTLTYLETSLETHKSNEQMLTKTMPQNPPISMYLGTKDDGSTYVWNGTNVVIKSLVVNWDFEHGGDTKIVCKLTVVEGAYQNLP